jgi:hypothetical protein
MVPNLSVANRAGGLQRMSSIGKPSMISRLNLRADRRPLGESRGLEGPSESNLRLRSISFSRNLFCLASRRRKGKVLAWIPLSLGQVGRFPDQNRRLGTGHELIARDPDQKSRERQTR